MIEGAPGLGIETQLIIDERIVIFNPSIQSWCVCVCVGRLKLTRVLSSKDDWSAVPRRD